MKKRSSKKNIQLPGSHLTGLKPEDALLWHRVTETLQPIDKKAQNQAGFEIEYKIDSNSESMPKPAKKADRQVQSTTLPKPSSQPKEPPPLNQIEKRLNRRISRGHANFDARIDLHGMTQFEAHGALLSFLRNSQARGCKVALVITGKGRAEDARDHFSMTQAPGVLRRSIRGWLEQPEFRTLVSAYAQAHQRHGGDGAIYVQIRRNRP